MRSRPLMTLRLNTGSTQNVGAGPHGARVTFPIKGGSFEGDRLRGMVLSGGSDWTVKRSDGVVELGLRITLETTMGPHPHDVRGDQGRRSAGGHLLSDVAAVQDVARLILAVAGEYSPHEMREFPSTGASLHDYEVFIAIRPFATSRFSIRALSSTSASPKSSRSRFAPGSTS